MGGWDKGRENSLKYTKKGVSTIHTLADLFPMENTSVNYSDAPIPNQAPYRYGTCSYAPVAPLFHGCAHCKKGRNQRSRPKDGPPPARRHCYFRMWNNALWPVLTRRVFGATASGPARSCAAQRTFRARAEGQRSAGRDSLGTNKLGCSVRRPEPPSRPACAPSVGFLNATALWTPSGGCGARLFANRRSRAGLKPLFPRWP